MRKTILWVFAISLLVPWPGQGQTDKPIKSETARFGNPTMTARQLQDLFYGVVKSLGKKEIVLEKTMVGVDQNIKLNEKTKYTADGAPSTLDKLKVGDQVWLRIKTDKKTGVMQAERVYSGVVAPTVRK